MKYQKRENNFWNEFAGKYDGFINKYANGTYIKIKEKLLDEIKADELLLEVGTGTGIFSFFLAEHVNNIIATDFSVEMIKVAKRKQKDLGITNIVFETGDVNQLLFDDNSMDIILAVNVFHLLENPALALSEIRRVLKQDGKLIIPTYCHGQGLKSKMISAFMRLYGFKARNKWSLYTFKTFIEGSFMVHKDIIIPGTIPLSYIVASKKT